MIPCTHRIQRRVQVNRRSSYRVHIAPASLPAASRDWSNRSRSHSPSTSPFRNPESSGSCSVPPRLFVPVRLTLFAQKCCALSWLCSCVRDSADRPALIPNLLKELRQRLRLTWRQEFFKPVMPGRKVALNPFPDQSFKVAEVG